MSTKKDGCGQQWDSSGRAIQSKNEGVHQNRQQWDGVGQSTGQGTGHFMGQQNENFFCLHETKS